MQRHTTLLILCAIAPCLMVLWGPSPALSWTAPLNLSGDADPTTWAGIAVGLDRTLHAVWTDATTHQMSYTSRAPGETWSAPTIVASYAGTSYFADGDIVVAVAPDGTAHILYADDSSGDSEIYHRSKPPSGTWSTPVNISQTIGTRSEFPDIAVSPDGTVHAVWMDATPSGSLCCGETYYASLAPGGSWTAPLNVSNSAPNEYEMRVGVGPDNSVHIISAQEDGGPGRQNLYYYTKLPGGGFGSGENLTGTADRGRNMGGVLKTGDGTVHIVYYECSPCEVMYMNLPACGEWSTPINLSNNTSLSSNPYIAADGCGNIHVAWCDDADGGGILYTGRTTAGSWSVPLLSKIIRPAARPC